jgi:hypothetical protein
MTRHIDSMRQDGLNIAAHSAQRRQRDRCAMPMRHYVARGTLRFQRRRLLLLLLSRHYADFRFRHALFFADISRRHFHRHVFSAAAYFAAAIDAAMPLRAHYCRRHAATPTSF